MSTTSDGYLERPGRHAAVAAVWSHTAAASGTSWIAADGCFDLIVKTSARGDVSSLVYTPTASVQRTSTLAAERVIGVRLRPGYGAVLRTRADLVARAVEHVCRGEDLETLVISALEEHARPPHVVRDLVLAARETKGAIRLGARSSRTSEREIQRACRVWLGMSAKSFLRIERVWAAREAIGAGTPLAQAAAELGYADQAHLSREVKALLGVSPRSLRAVGNLQDLASPAR